MAAPATRHILHMPGRLIKDPTDLSLADPYGGTKLGIFKSVTFSLKIEHHPITAEEWGNQVVEVIHAGSSIMIGATLREFDKDALAALFLDTETGSPSGETLVHFRADSGRAGTKLSTLAMKLVFVPRAAVRQPTIYIRQAVPVIAPETAIALATQEEVGIPVLFYGVPDSNEDVGQMGRLGDLTL